MDEKRKYSLGELGEYLLMFGELCEDVCRLGDMYDQLRTRKFNERRKLQPGELGNFSLACARANESLFKYMRRIPETLKDPATEHGGRLMELSNIVKNSKSLLKESGVELSPSRVVQISNQ